MVDWFKGMKCPFARTFNRYAYIQILEKEGSDKVAAYLERLTPQAVISIMCMKRMVEREGWDGIQRQALEMVDLYDSEFRGCTSP